MNVGFDICIKTVFFEKKNPFCPTQMLCKFPAIKEMHNVSVIFENRKIMNRYSKWKLVLKVSKEVKPLLKTKLWFNTYKKIIPSKIVDQKQRHTFLKGYSENENSLLNCRCFSPDFLSFSFALINMTDVN